MCAVVAAGVLALFGSRQGVTAPDARLPELEAHFQSSWAGLKPAARAPDVLVLRRLTLALCGTVPSLEELRAFEADPSLERATARLLDDPRFHRYFAERWTRVFVGTKQGAFLVYRRDL